VSYAHFEANPCEVLVAESEIEEGQTEEQHAAELEALKDSIPDEEWLERQNAARKVFSRAFKRMREEEPDSKAEAALLVEEWLNFEKECRAGSAEERESNISAVQKKMPKTVKKRRKIAGPGTFPAVHFFLL
jgi:crooked neck